MEDPGHLIATCVLLLYTILGPLVLLAIYVLYDFLSQSGRTKNKQQDTASTKDPALWTSSDINRYMNRM